MSLFAFSMTIRFVLFLVAVAFSPPVLLLCLIALVFSHHQDWEYGRCFSSSNDFDISGSDIQRGLRNIRRFCNFSHTQQQARGAETAAAGPCRRRFARNFPNVEREAETRGESQQQQQSQEVQQQESDFEGFRSPDVAAKPATSATSTSASSSRNPSPRLATLRSSTGNRTQSHTVPVHRTETDESLTLSLDISGFDIAHLQVMVKHSELVIRGERQNTLGDTFVMEERTVLDDEQFLEDSVTAHAVDGILNVTIRKNPVRKSRVISITTTGNTTEKEDNQIPK